MLPLPVIVKHEIDGEQEHKGFLVAVETSDERVLLISNGGAPPVRRKKKQA